MHVQSIRPAISANRRHTVVKLHGTNGEHVDLELSPDEFASMVGSLVEFQIQEKVADVSSESTPPPVDVPHASDTAPLEVAEVLSDTHPEIAELPPDPRLLIATRSEIVGWTGGACLVQIETSTGATLQIGLPNNVETAVREALNMRSGIKAGRKL